MANLFCVPRSDLSRSGHATVLTQPGSGNIFIGRLKQQRRLSRCCHNQVGTAAYRKDVSARSALSICSRLCSRNPLFSGRSRPCSMSVRASFNSFTAE